MECAYGRDQRIVSLILSAVVLLLNDVRCSAGLDQYSYLHCLKSWLYILKFVFIVDCFQAKVPETLLWKYILIRNIDLRA